MTCVPFSHLTVLMVLATQDCCVCRYEADRDPCIYEDGALRCYLIVRPIIAYGPFAG